MDASTVKDGSIEHTVDPKELERWSGYCLEQRFICKTRMQ